MIDFNAMMEFLLTHGWRFLVALVVGLVIILGRKKFAYWIFSALKKISFRFPLAEQILTAFEKPTASFFAGLGLFLATWIVMTAFFVPVASSTLFLFVYRAFKVWLIICVTRGLMRGSVPILEMIQGRKKSEGDLTVFIFFSKIVNIVFAVIAGLIIINEIGYDISGLLTGLGLSGLTFALAAQDTASNLFGGIVIITDKPFSVDDWIETPSLEGIVTDITLRSTRIRTFKDAEVIVPNSTLANTPITNWSRMSKRRVHFSIGLTYDTSKETLEEVVSVVKKILEEHEDVDENGVVVVFGQFGSYSLDVQIYYFIKRTTWGEYMAVKEDINFKIMSAVQGLNAHFAFPTQTIVMHKELIEKHLAE